MNESEQRVRKQASKAITALNPQFFNNAHNVPVNMDGFSKLYERLKSESKPLISNPEAIAPHFMRESTDESKLNKTEKAYLSILRSSGHHWIGIQCISLKLGDDCRYNPDFLVLNASGFLEVHEVKGFMREDALVKLKTAARMYRFFKFLVVRRLKGQWQTDQVRP